MSSSKVRVKLDKEKLSIKGENTEQTITAGLVTHAQSVT